MIYKKGHNFILEVSVCNDGTKKYKLTLIFIHANAVFLPFGRCMLLL